MISFRYRDIHSPVHRLSPFAKLAWVVSMMVVSFIFEHPLYLAILFASTLPPVIMSGTVRQWGRLILFSLIVGFGIMVINAIVINQGSTVLLEATYSIPTLGVPRITMEAIFFSLTMVFRIVIIVSAFCVYNFTIHPDDQLLAMIQLKLPYKSVLVISLSARFVPALMEDLDRLTVVQQSRGMVIDSGNIFKRIKNRSTVLVPLLANSLDRCIQIAEAMEARAFGQGKNRTFFRRLNVSCFDAATIILSLLPLLTGILLAVNGYGTYDAYTDWRIYPPSGFELLCFAVFLILSFLLAFSGLLKRRIDLD